MKFSAVVTRYFSFTGLSQNNPKWEGSEEVSSSTASAPRSLSHAAWGGPPSPCPPGEGDFHPAPRLKAASWSSSGIWRSFSCRRAKEGWSFQPCEQRGGGGGGALLFLILLPPWKAGRKRDDIPLTTTRQASAVLFYLKSNRMLFQGRSALAN